MRTALHANPFWILGVSIRDSRKHIIAVAEERQLELDPQVCAKARDALLTPRARLEAEIAWLPGVAPRRAIQIVQSISSSVADWDIIASLPALARANAIAACCESVQPLTESAAITLIRELVHAVDTLSPSHILQHLLEERAVSGFSLTVTEQSVEEAVSERMRTYYRRAATAALKRLTPDSRGPVLKGLIQSTTDGGSLSCPELLEAVIDSFELDTRPQLDREAQQLRSLLKSAREAATTGEAEVSNVVPAIYQSLRRWGENAGPVLQSRKLRGQKHALSHECALDVRALAVDLYNEHGFLRHSQRITNLLSEVFSDLPSVADLLASDREALGNLYLQSVIDLVTSVESGGMLRFENVVVQDNAVGFITDTRNNARQRFVTWREITVDSDENRVYIAPKGDATFAAAIFFDVDSRAYALDGALRLAVEHEVYRLSAVKSYATSAKASRTETVSQAFVKEYRAYARDVIDNLRNAATDDEGAARKVRDQIRVWAKVFDGLGVPVSIERLTLLLGDLHATADEGVDAIAYNDCIHMINELAGQTGRSDLKQTVDRFRAAARFLKTHLTTYEINAVRDALVDGDVMVHWGVGQGLRNRLRSGFFDEKFLGVDDLDDCWESIARAAVDI